MSSNAGLGAGQDAEISRRHIQKLHDPNVTFEEYLHYAEITRNSHHEAQEKKLHAPNLNSIAFWRRMGKNAVNPDREHYNDHPPDDKSSPSSEKDGHMPISEEEYVQASRAVRTATWGAVFYLITTDILGPFSTA